MGADGIELDVHASADGILVVHHDAEIDGVSIPGSTYEDVVQRTSVQLPTLPVALHAIGPDTIVYIELKTLDAGWDAALFSVIDSAPDPSRCQVHAFDHRIIQRVLSKRTDLIGGVLSASYPLDPVTPIVQARAHTLWQEGTVIDAQLVEAVHQAGRTIIAWTVDDETRIRYLQSMGVDGICCNKPDAARAALR